MLGVAWLYGVTGRLAEMLERLLEILLLLDSYSCNQLAGLKRLLRAVSEEQDASCLGGLKSVVMKFTDHGW